MNDELEAERAVIGSMMIDGRGLKVGIGLLGMSDFKLDSNRFMFEAAVQCSEDGVDVDAVAVISKLQLSKKVDAVGGAASVFGCIESVTSTENVYHYAKIVRRASLERQLDAHIDVLHADKSEENIVKLRALVSEINGIYQSSAFDFRRDMAGAIESILSARPKIVRTGFPSLDEQLGGSEPGDLVTVGARTSGGKTAIMVKMMRNMAEAGIECMYMTTEMTSKQIVARVIPAVAGVPFWKIRECKLNASDRDAIKDAGSEKLSRLPIIVYDSPRIALSDIRAQAQKHHPAVIFFDYLQRAVLPEGNNRAYQIMDFMSELKTFAMETGTVVFMGCQLSRGLDRVGASTPTNADLKDSGAIEAESDQIILLWKKSIDEIMAINSPLNRDTHVHISALVSKNRHGQAGTVSDLALHGSLVDMIDTKEKSEDEEEIPFS